MRFSRGETTATYEEDIGPQVVHAYTLTNRGPFYARNVTVTINWPLKLHAETQAGEHWVLYTLEEPVVRHGGHLRRCPINPLLHAVNPLDVYNDATLKLTYQPRTSIISGQQQPRARQPRAAEPKAANEEGKEPEWSSEKPRILKEANEVAEDESPKMASSIFDNRYIEPKEIEESSGARIRIIGVVGSSRFGMDLKLETNFCRIAKTTLPNAFHLRATLTTSAQMTQHSLRFALAFGTRLSLE